MTANKTLYLMVGFPRAGKSTWIYNNKERLDAIVIENDWIRENILHAPNSKSTEPAIWMIVDSCMRILLSQGKNVILDGINLTSFTRKFFIDAAKECDARIVFVWINTPLEECLSRNSRLLDHKITNEILKRVGANFESPMSHEYDEIILV